MITLSTTVLVILVLAIVFCLPAWPWSRGWGAWPGTILAVLVFLLLLDVLGLIRVPGFHR